MIEDSIFSWQTKISNPKFLAEIFNEATVISFSITEDGLKDKL